MGTETYVNIYSPIYEEWEMTGKRRERRIGIEGEKQQRAESSRKYNLCGIYVLLFTSHVRDMVILFKLEIAVFCEFNRILSQSGSIFLYCKFVIQTVIL